MTALDAPPRVRTRITGIDVARALAILGMIMVHFGPFRAGVDTVGSMVYRFTYGRASVLFVLLAGVGISLLFRTRTTEQAWLQVAWRALVFYPLGVFLQSLDTPVAVILQFYAMYYLVGGLAALLPNRVLAPLAITWAVLGPALYTTLRGPVGRGNASDLGDPALVVGELVWNGFYPLITWAPPLLIGLLIGRADLRDTMTRVVLAVGGLTFAVFTYGGAELARRTGQSAASSPWLIAEGHTGSPLNVIGATAVAVSVLGMCLLLAGWLPRLTWPLAASGQMALTVYVGHLFILDWVPTLLVSRADYAEAAFKVGRFYLLAVLFCVLWRLRFRRGPLEYLLGLPFERRNSQLRTGQSRVPPGLNAPAREGDDQWQTAVSMTPTSSISAPKPLSPWAPTSTSPSGTPPPSN